jgi:TATA-box binding protein (TBP) (component of TFIID and TFIIIB)
MTAVGAIGIDAVDIHRFATEVPLKCKDDIVNARSRGFCYVELAQKKKEIVSRGEPSRSAVRLAKLRAASKTHHCFDNQATAIYAMQDGTTVNLKLFRNGNVQMTGVKAPHKGEEALAFLSDTVNDLFPELENKCRPSRFRICMINTNFDIGFHVKRDVLTSIIKSNYRTRASFEPCGYTGVKIMYLYNTISTHNAAHGVCCCSQDGTNPCRGTGYGNGLGDCRKVTIVVFQSGHAIITGGHSMEHILAAHAFICRVVVDHRQAIELHKLQ